MKAMSIIKARILFRQNVIIIFAIVAWFGANFIILLFENIFSFMAVEYLFFIETGPSAYDQFYSRWGDYVMFTLVLGVINVEAYRNYHPLKTCEILASKLANHAIIFGFTSIGARIKALLEKNDIPCVVASRNEDEVADLVEKEDPTIIYKGIDENLMNRVNMNRARYVFLCEDNNFQNLNILIHARKINPLCTMVAHVIDETLIMDYKNYDCHPIATLTFQTQDLIKDHVDSTVDELFFIGFNMFTQKAIDLAIVKGIKCICIEKDAADLKDFKAFYDSKTVMQKKMLLLVDGSCIDRDVLEGSGIFHAKIIIITEDIEDYLIHVVTELKHLNPNVKIIVRCFNDDNAKIFESMGCETISTSQYELEDEIKPFLKLKK